MIATGVLAVGVLVLATLPQRWIGSTEPSTVVGDVLGAQRAIAKADGSFFVGFADDALKFYGARVAAPARDVGARAFRVTLRWEPGQTAIGADDARDLERAVAQEGLRVVLSVYGSSGATAPLTADARDAYCTYVRNTLARFPSIEDVVIWNEPNKSHFWRPQFEKNESAAPAAYAALLAQCWDALHSLRSSVNVIGIVTSPRGNDRPDAASNVSHSPGSFIRAVGEAYRASGRRAPIFDTVGHHVYGETSAERPWKRHDRSTTIAQGDWVELMQALWDGFNGTAQPIPGECNGGRCVSIWYLESGFQTAVDVDKSLAYAGADTEAHPLPDAGGGDPPGSNPGADSAAPDQATQATDAIRLAYCQPYVGAYFNFLLVDEQELAGWQSGAMWADFTPKDSYGAFKRAIGETASGAVDCAHLKGGAPPTTFKPLTTVELERVAWPKAASFNWRNDLWRFRIETGEDASYTSTLYRVDGRQARNVVATTTGDLRQGYFAFVRFPARRLAPGSYQMETRLVSAANPARQAVRTGPVFEVEPRTAPARRGKARSARPPAAARPTIKTAVPFVLLSEEPQVTFTPKSLTAMNDVRIVDIEGPLESELLAEINRVRRAHGLSSLRNAPALARAGDAHVRALGLSGQFRHEWPDGRPFGKWMIEYYRMGTYRVWSVGENLLWNTGEVTPQAAVQAWLDSPPHRRVLLSPRWREAGIGVVFAEGAGGHYPADATILAAEFGARR